MFLSYILFELLDDEHGFPISQKNVKCNSPGLTLAIDPYFPKGNFVHYDFQVLHYISHKMKYVRSLRVAALAGNIILRTLPPKITLNFPVNVSQYASTLVMSPLTCNSQLYILPINIFDNFSK